MNHILLVGLLSLSHLGISQTTFNIRTIFDFPSSVLTSLVPTDSCYYATGIITDSVFPYKTGNIFLKFDLTGTPLFFKTITSPAKTYETWFAGLHLLEDGNFMVHGISYDSLEKTILIKYDHNGDTIFIKEFLNPFYPTYNRIQPRGGFCVVPDGGFLLSNWIDTGNLPNTDIYLIKTDSLGNIEWDKILGDTKWDRPQSLIMTPDGKIIIGAIQTNDNVATENYIYRCHVFQTDSLGNLEWEYLTPTSIGLRDAANDMILLGDGSLVIASGIGHEIERSSINEVHFDKMIFKLSPDMAIEWETTFVDPQLTSSSRTTKLLNLSDSSGLVIAGVASSEQLPSPVLGANRGWITKVSHQGNSIWTRQYVYIDDSPSDHIIYDMKETPDGGFIICGEARDLGIGAEYPQQAWLLKLDGYGCLIPGCHLLDGSDEEKKEAIHFSIYPNPAVDYLNFQILGNPSLINGQVNISDVTGRILQSFLLNGYQGETFILPVLNYPTGIYNLQYLVDGKIAGTEKFIISK